MSGVFGQKVSLGQANGPDVDLVVTGTEYYATYETPDGFPAIYDENLGLFCYARVVNGRYESTGVPVTSPTPPDVEPHSKESDEVRAAKFAERRGLMMRRGQITSEKE